MNIQHRARVVIATTAMVFAVAACGQKEEATVGQEIEVDTVQGVVSLSGPAPSADAAERATVLARAVEGVTAVQNRLVVNKG